MNSPVRPDRQWQRPVADDDSDYIDIKRIWSALWSRRWKILVFVLAVTALTALLVMRMTPIFKATTTVMIEARGQQLLSFQQMTTPDGELSEYLQTQIGLIKSRGVAEKVVRELKLAQHPEFDPRMQSSSLFDIRGWLIELQAFLLPGVTLIEPKSGDGMTEAEVMDIVTRSFMETVGVWVEGKSQLVGISVSMADRLTAADAANALANAYIESQLEAKVDMSMTAATWMNSRLTDLRTALQDSEARLQTFLEAEGLVDMNGVETISANELNLVGDRMIDARRQRAEAESQYRQVQAMRSAGWERLTSVPAVLGHPLIQQFKTDQARALARVEDLSRRYGEQHPAMQSARSDLNAATASLQNQVEQVVASIERNYQLAVANEKSLNASFEKNKEQIQDISRKEYQVRELQRDVETNRALYETFLTRLRETTATSDLSTTNARIVDMAIPPVEPTAPNKKLYMIVAVFLAVVVGIGLALVMDVLNNTFKSSDDVEAKLNLPVMGIMPLVPKRTRHEVAQFFQRNTDRSFSEAIRTIRTNIMLGEANHPRQVLVVTSTAPGEGKSSLATNLAFAMGQLQRVLLIDADLRRPTLARNFKFPAGTPGLANLIAGTATIEECIQSEGDVDMLLAGTVPPNPLELLSSPSFVKLLDAFKSRYDRIIIDSPPSLAVSDASLLSTLANAVVYVIKSESTMIPHAEKGVGQLLQSGAPVTGVVLNQVDIKKARKDGKFNGYYDLYGYTEQQHA